MNRNEVKWGAILAYILIIINAIYGFVITPFILGKLGKAEYGVYKTISSFTASLMVLDLGLGGTLIRYIAKFRASREDGKIPNFIAMSLIQATFLCVIIFGVSVGLYFTLDAFFAKGLTLQEIEKAKQLYIFLCLGIIAHLYENVLNGTISGYNKFSVSNGLKLFRILFRAGFVLIGLNIVQDSLVIVIIDLVLTILLLIIEFLYLLFKLKVKPILTKWDNKVFKSSFKYTILLFITSIAAQVNNNLDNVAIGAIISADAVAIYSIGLVIFGMFEQLSTSISSVMLPTITVILENDDDIYSKTQEEIIKVGRIQFMLLGAALAGFTILGDAFIKLWLGSGYQDAYLVSIILMIPSLFELCVNVCLSVLRAKNNLGFRTFVLLGTTVVNAIITVVGTCFFGYFAAAVGTAFSFLVGSVIMNIYYYKKYNFRMINIYKRIFGRTWICILLASAICFVASYFIQRLLIKFIVGFFAFIIIYITTLLLFGLNNEEKSIFRKRIIKEKNNG